MGNWVVFIDSPYPRDPEAPRLPPSMMGMALSGGLFCHPKFAPIFDPLKKTLGSVLDPQNGTKIDQKSIKIGLGGPSFFGLRFRIVFYRFVIDFSAIFIDFYRLFMTFG